MSFLGPWFLLGALVIGLPILFHLTQRTTRQRFLFSSLMHVQPLPPRLNKRSRLEHLLLLMLRGLVILLLTVGFARPFWISKTKVPGGPQTGRSLVILLDVSASMQQEPLWREARKKAGEILQQADGLDQVAVLTFARETTLITSFEQWNRLPVAERQPWVRQQLAALSPGWGGTHLDTALLEAVEILEDIQARKRGGSRELVVVSDFQSGAHTHALAGYAWPSGLTVKPVFIPGAPASNAGLQLLPSGDEGTAVPVAAAARVRVSNAPESQRDQFQVGWMAEGSSGYVVAPVEIRIPPGQTRVINLPFPPVSVKADRAVLAGDEAAFDNTNYLAQPSLEPLSVIYLGSEDRQDARQPLYFLSRALQQSMRMEVKVIASAPSQAISEDLWRTASLFFVTEPVPENTIQKLQMALAAGKTVVAAAKAAAMAATLAKLFERPLPAFEEVRCPNYALLGQINFQHPLFAPFAAPQYADFAKIRFWQYRRMDWRGFTNATLLARFDQGDPALVEIPVGQGRVVVMASLWHPADSQMGLSSKFVPMVCGLLNLEQGLESLASQWLVGDQASMPTTRPGIFRVPKVIGAPGGGTKVVAVNVDPAESRTSPLSEADLSRLGLPMQPARFSLGTTAGAQQLKNTELEQRQKLWRWLIAAAMVFLLAESWLAGRTHRMLPPTPGNSMA